MRAATATIMRATAARSRLASAGLADASSSRSVSSAYVVNNAIRRALQRSGACLAQRDARS